ncbi:MAG TPA: transaldolase, partial [Synergistaceae bacterium]|nr:transaldolase [Synergistaceae bacterium]
MERENTIQQALRHGQSIWCDFLSRSLLRSGELDDMIRMGVRGVTTNPSIFEKAIGQTNDYDEDILAYVRQGRNREEIYTALTVADVREGADHFLSVYETSGGGDGFVSLEVSPMIAHDMEATVKEAKALAELVDRKNVMIKIPATPAGVQALRRCTAEGLCINATLIFSRHQYRDVA